jgi:hypothetical protein
MEPIKFAPTAHALRWQPTDDHQATLKLAQTIRTFLEVRTGANWTFEVKSDLSAAFYGSVAFGGRAYRVQPEEWVVWFLNDVHLVRDENMW